MFELLLLTSGREERGMGKRVAIFYFGFEMCKLIDFFGKYFWITRVHGKMEFVVNFQYLLPLLI